MKENKANDIDRHIIEAYKAQEVSVPSVDKAWEHFTGSLPAAKTLRKERHLNDNLMFLMWNCLLVVLFTSIAYIIDFEHDKLSKTTNGSANFVNANKHMSHLRNATEHVEKTKNRNNAINHIAAGNMDVLLNKVRIFPEKNVTVRQSLPTLDIPQYLQKYGDEPLHNVICEMPMRPIRKQSASLNFGNNNSIKTENKEDPMRKHIYSSHLDIYSRFSVLQNPQKSNGGFPGNLQLGLRYTQQLSRLLSADVGLALGQYRMNSLQFDGVSKYGYDSSLIAKSVDSFSGYLKKFTYLEMPIRIGLNVHPHWTVLLGMDIRFRLRNNYTIVNKKYQDSGGIWQCLGTDQTTLHTNPFNKAFTPDFGWNLGLQYQCRRHILNVGYRSDLYFNNKAPAQADVFSMHLYKAQPFGELYFSYALRLF